MFSIYFDRLCFIQGGNDTQIKPLGSKCGAPMWWADDNLCRPGTFPIMLLTAVVSSKTAAEPTPCFNLKSTIFVLGQ
jgi:hypothetical protein